MSEFKKLTAGLAAVGVIVLLAGCAAPADDGTGGTGGDSSAAVAEAQAGVEAAMAEVTEFTGPTDQYSPPTGINLALVPCASVVDGCVTPADGAREAAELLGWHVETYDGKGTPADQNNAVSQAIAAGADAILLVGIDPKAIQSSLQQAADKGVPVGSIGQGVAPGDGVAFDVGINYVKGGKIKGQWIVADSKGKAVVLPTNDKEYQSTILLVEGAIAAVKECSTCKVLPQEYFVSTDIGNGLGQRIASVLQQNPDVNYLIGAFDPAVSDMVPAIQSAGIADRVSIVSNVGSVQNLGYIRDGLVQKADLVFDNTYEGWAGVDQISRVLLGMPLWENEGETDPRFMYTENAPLHLLTKDNLPKDGKPWAVSFDTKAEFSKVWSLK